MKSPVATFYATLPTLHKTKKGKKDKWTVAGNESHNLPRTFEAMTTVTVPRVPVPPPHTNKTKRRPRPKLRLEDLHVSPFFIHILKFLSNKDLFNWCLVSWELAVLTRAVVKRRVEHRIERVQQLEEEASRDTDDMAKGEDMRKQINKVSITTLRKVNNGTEGIRRLGECVAVCFGLKPEWKEFLHLAQDASVLTAMMLNYDKKTVTTRLLAKLEPYVKHPTFNKEAINKCCSDAVPIYIWVQGVYLTGTLSFKPWESDRMQMKTSCVAYLESIPNLIRPQHVLSLDMDEVHNTLAKAEPVTTTDTFGNTV